MPAEVINTVCQLMTASKKFKGIVFTDKDGNVIDDTAEPHDDILEITSVDDKNVLEITGMDDITHYKIQEWMTTTQDIQDIENYERDVPQDRMNVTGMENSTNNISSEDNGEHNAQYDERSDDDIPIENESLKDTL